MDEIKFTKNEYLDENGNNIEFPKPPEPEIMYDNFGSIGLTFPFILIIVVIVLFLSK